MRRAEAMRIAHDIADKLLSAQLDNGGAKLPEEDFTGAELRKVNNCLSELAVRHRRAATENQSFRT